MLGLTRIALTARTDPKQPLLRTSNLVGLLARAGIITNSYSGPARLILPRFVGAGMIRLIGRPGIIATYSAKREPLCCIAEQETSLMARPSRMPLSCRTGFGRLARPDLEPPPVSVEHR